MRSSIQRGRQLREVGNDEIRLMRSLWPNGRLRRSMNAVRMPYDFAPMQSNA